MSVGASCRRRTNLRTFGCAPSLRRTAIRCLPAARYYRRENTFGDIAILFNECLIHILDSRFKQVKNCLTCPSGSGAAKCHTRAISQRCRHVRAAFCHADHHPGEEEKRLHRRNCPSIWAFRGFRELNRRRNEREGAWEGWGVRVSTRALGVQDAYYDRRTLSLFEPPIYL